MPQATWLPKLKHCFTQCFSCIAFTAALIFAMPVTAEESAVSFSIQPQSLSAALRSFADQSGRQLTFAPDTVEGIASQGLSGVYQPTAALDKLISGTNLSYRVESGGVIVVEVAQQDTSGADGKAPKRLRDGSSKRFEMIEEVMVTATKRSESIQDVPISMTALNSEHIAQTGSQNLQDIANSIPNFLWPNGFVPNQANISIRGIFANVVGEAVGFDQGFGVYLDGVYLGKQNAVNTDLGAIERVEVLRGPQGTLFGKNTIAGAINIVSKRPDNELAGKVDVDVGNYNLNRVRGSINIPLVEDKLAMRLSVGNVRRDGYVENLVGGEDHGNIDQQSGFFQVGYTPTLSTRVQLNIDVLKSDSEFYFWEYPEDDNAPYTIFTDEVDRSHSDNKGMSLTLEHEMLNGFVVTSITGLRDDEVYTFLDLESTPLDTFNFSYVARQEMLTQEVRLASPTGKSYDFVAGLYYFDQGNTVKTSWHAGQDWLGFIGPDWVGQTFFDQSVDVKSYAAFVHANVYLSDRFTLFGGARYTSETKELVAHPNTCMPVALCPNLGIPLVGDVRAPVDVDAKEPSWTIGLRYTPSDAVMAYGSVSRGFKSGAFNNSFNPVADYAAQNLVAAPEFVTNYEIGAKTNWMDNRVKANLALFYMDYTDLQVRTWCPTCGGIGENILTNAASVVSKGFEAELIAYPSDRLSVTAGIGYVHSVFDKFEGVTDIRPVALGGLGVIDASGNRVPLAPDWTVNVAIQHETPLAGGSSLVARLDYRYVDDRYSQPANTQDEFLPSYNMVDARLGYHSADGHWRVSLWAKNLTDEQTYTDSRFASFITNGVTRQYILPRTYGLSLRYDYF